MRAFLPLLIAAALLAGCSNRERANPLDPANPVSQGRPVGFNAIAGYDVVSLEWTPQPGLTIDGFQIQRLATGDSLYRNFGTVLPPAVGRIEDLTVRNGSTYRYRLYYVIQGALGHRPAEDVATPGPLRPWVADAGSGTLVELSPDGRDMIASYDDAGSVQSVAVDRSDGRVWTSATGDAIVSARHAGDPAPLLLQGVGQPFTLAVSSQDGSVWFCDLDGSLRHYSFTGTPLPSLTTPINLPTGVAVSPRDYSVWVCENSGNRVRRIDSAGRPLATAFVVSPSRVAVDSLTGDAWVTSLETGRIWRLSPLGAVLDSSGAASGPIGIALDSRRGRAWIADAAGNRVLALDLATMELQFSVTGLTEARDVDVDLATGEAWVVVRASREIVRLSTAGAVLQRLGGFSDPAEVRLDPGVE